MSSELWSFVRRTGLEGWQIGFLIVGLVLLAGGVISVRDLWRLPRHKVTRRDVVATLSLFATGAFFLLMIGLSIRKRYLLQPNSGHYTVGTVYQHKWQKGQQKYLLEYYVAGQRWQTSEFCGIEEWKDVPCPALGSRRYVRFAPEEPSTAEIVSKPVPDSVRVIPPLGWAKLP